MADIEVNYQKVSVKQANSNAELAYKAVQYEVLAETLQDRVNELERQLAEATSSKDEG